MNIWRNMCRGFKLSPDVIAAYVYDVRDNDGCVIAKTGLTERDEDVPHMVDYLVGFIFSKEINMRGELMQRVKSGVVKTRDGVRLSYQYNMYYTDSLLTTPATLYVVGRIGTTLFLVVWESSAGVSGEAARG